MSVQGTYPRSDKHVRTCCRNSFVTNSAGGKVIPCSTHHIAQLTIISVAAYRKPLYRRQILCIDVNQNDVLLAGQWNISGTLLGFCASL